MDTLTHALSGALLARATGRAGAVAPAVPLLQRVTVGTVAAAFPDIDYVANLVSPVAYLLNHRGVTHSLVMLPLWAWLLALLAALAFRNPRGWRAYWGVAALGLGTHILGDLITSFGTMVFAPLSDTRYAWGTTFIIDLWFTGIILCGLLLSYAWKRSRVPALAGIAVLVGYVGFQAGLKSEAIEFGASEAAARNISAARVTAQPGAVSPFNWMVVIERDGQYRFAMVNLVRREVAPEPSAQSGFFYRLSAPFNPRGAAVWSTAGLRSSGPDADFALEAWNRPELAFFRWFAEYPALYRIDRGNPETCAWFYDLRFFRPGSDFLPFRFGVCRQGELAWRRFRLVDEDERVSID